MINRRIDEIGDKSKDHSSSYLNTNNHIDLKHFTSSYSTCHTEGSDNGNKFFLPRNQEIDLKYDKIQINTPQNLCRNNTIKESSFETIELLEKRMTDINLSFYKMRKINEENSDKLSNMDKICKKNEKMIEELVKSIDSMSTDSEEINTQICITLNEFNKRIWDLENTKEKRRESQFMNEGIKKVETFLKRSKTIKREFSEKFNLKELNLKDLQEDNSPQKITERVAYMMEMSGDKITNLKNEVKSDFKSEIERIERELGNLIKEEVYELDSKNHININSFNKGSVERI
jgi:hypothetical protein